MRGYTHPNSRCEAEIVQEHVCRRISQISEGAKGKIYWLVKGTHRTYRVTKQKMKN